MNIRKKKNGLLKVNVKELASLNDNVHYMITNLENLLEFLREYKLKLHSKQRKKPKNSGNLSLISSFTKFKTNVVKLSEISARLTAIFSYRTQHSIS